MIQNWAKARQWEWRTPLDLGEIPKVESVGFGDRPCVGETAEYSRIRYRGNM